MNKPMTISVKFDGDGTKAKYETLAVKMNEDAEFKSKLGFCKNNQEVYNLYKERGYTDLSFEDFEVQFNETINQITNVQNEGSFELEEEELENVVGGFDFFRFCTNVVGLIPIAGPIISGVAKAVKAGIDGKGGTDIFNNILVGCAGGMLDALVTVGTAGAGTGLSTTYKVIFGSLKVGANEALA